jgi:NitT/TauT family transport system substrate-binding protein
MIRLWQATQGSANPALAIEANSALGLYLISSDPKVRSVADFGPNDRIALPAVKVSAQALTLQMAVAAALGKEKYAALDGLTVSMPHADAAAAMLSRKLGITAHFGQSPFIDQELAEPGFHTVLSTFDVFGPDATNEVLVTTTRFRTDRRKLYDVVVSAHRAAMKLIMSDRKRAAAIYVAETQAKLTTEAIEKILSKPRSNYTPVPRGTMRFATFMHETGQIKRAPAQWRDLFFPEIHDADGS